MATLKKNYYVEITISGCICVEAESEDDAIFVVKEAVKSNNDVSILEDIGDMLRRHVDDGDINVGDAFEEGVSCEGNGFNEDTEEPGNDESYDD